MMRERMAARPGSRRGLLTGPEHATDPDPAKGSVAHTGTASAKPATSQAKALQRDLLGWYEKARRDLPWRRTRDPWAIWVSEIMLQQTRVETVIPYFERFLARFPTPQALAEAPEDDVLSM